MAGEEKSEHKGPAAEKEQPRTPEYFITRWPLYTPFDCPGFTPPNPISFDCEECGKETTWGLSHNYSPPGQDFTSARYQCGLCRKKYLTVMYRVSETTKRSIMGPAGTEYRYDIAQVQKIGQFPPLSIAIPKALQKNLGVSSTDLYKKSLISRNTNFGLGAVTYIRRVVQDKTDELIEVVAKLAEAHNVEPEVVNNIRAVKKERTTYEAKLKIAATVVPSSLVVDGANPLAVLYDLVSAGIPDLTEEQCTALADETKSVFEFTFTHLRAEIKVREDFVASVKKLTGKKLPEPSKEK